MVLPLTMDTMDHAQIVLIIKYYIEVEVIEELMDKEVATIWVQLGDKRRQSIVVGGIYREHQQLGRIEPDASWLEIIKQQEKRWKNIVRKWKMAAKYHNCVVLGDINLDFGRWFNPEPQLSNMVDLVQQEIEPAGFVQFISETTRSWTDQRYSILDHIWVNSPNKVIGHQNIVHASSDHNVIAVTMAGRDILTGGHNTRKRVWNFF